MKRKVVSNEGEGDMSGGRSRALMKRFGDELISQAYMEAVKQHTLLTPEQEIELGKVIEPIIDVRKQMDVLNERLVEYEKKNGECDPEAREMILRALADLEQEESAISQTAQFQDARNELITHNLRWVIKIAKRFRNKGLPFKDVIQEGNIGLMKAAERFEWRRGFRFTTFSTWWIRQGIARAIINTGPLIPLPSYIYELVPKVMASKEAFLTEYGREPTYEELAERCEQKVARIKNILTTGNRITSLETPTEDDSDRSRSLHNLLCRVDEEYEDIVFAKKRKQDIHAMLNTLTPTERDIIERRFEMNGHIEEQPYNEIADSTGLSHEGIRQIELKARAKLKRILSREKFKDYQSY